MMVSKREGREEEARELDKGIERVGGTRGREEERLMLMVYGLNTQKCIAFC